MLWSSQQFLRVGNSDSEMILKELDQAKNSSDSQLRNQHLVIAKLKKIIQVARSLT